MKSSEWEPPYQAPERSSQPAGYAWLVRKYQLNVLPHWRWTFIADAYVHRELERGGAVVHVLPPPRAPAESDIEQLLFALRHDGVSVPICRAFFAAADGEHTANGLAAAVRATPTGAFARRAWYLFEAITGLVLPLGDTKTGNYVPLLDPNVHVTGPVTRSRRHRVDVNLLGELGFAPVVRRTPAVTRIDSDGLARRFQAVMTSYDNDTVHRAISYLYTRETMASFEIENERPPSKRTERFIERLRRAPEIERIDEMVLLGLQRALVDPRFAAGGWRDEQVYVGESLGLARQRVHYVCPRFEDLSELMLTFLRTSNRLVVSGLEPVVIAAVISFAFVLIHPFIDGNGRIHRWLIHWALSRCEVVTADIILPVSAVMLSRRREYDDALESFSKRLMPHVDYQLDNEGRMTVEGQTVDLYRHPDLTAMAEALWRWLEFAVDEELPAELDLLASLDEARRQLQDVVDMPDRLIVLFIKLVRQNEGCLSAKKRVAHFEMLTDEEVGLMEASVRAAFGLGPM